ncbi:class I SAM-dependent methyltransferase [Chlorogloeopsis sp. ULAP02]|uniref:class I SAM-dependent methyltransferase n=1 Tax=Chlorogloeopsis sp. ULAP02 TaxID=3107926 RepID=UPI003134DF41
MQSIWRQRRMEIFLECMCPRTGARIIDIGGTPELWEMIDIDLQITLLNLPGVHKKLPNSLKRNYEIFEADACGWLSFADNEFDLVFSNSVIEHIGCWKQQKNFAANVRRLAPSYWVQTPSIWFPLEAHCNLPFWWFYPSCLKQVWLHHWKEQGQHFLCKQMAQTQIMSLRRLKHLFSEAKVYTEYVGAFPKSYSMYYSPSKFKDLRN